MLAKKRKKKDPKVFFILVLEKEKSTAKRDSAVQQDRVAVTAAAPFIVFLVFCVLNYIKNCKIIENELLEKVT